ncbi:hypothetical protein [Streptomyces fumanus]
MDDLGVPHGARFDAAGALVNYVFEQSLVGVDIFLAGIATLR